MHCTAAPDGYEYDICCVSDISHFHSPPGCHLFFKKKRKEKKKYGMAIKIPHFFFFLEYLGRTSVLLHHLETDHPQEAQIIRDMKSRQFFTEFTHCWDAIRYGTLFVKKPTRWVEILAKHILCQHNRIKCKAAIVCMPGSYTNILAALCYIVFC